MTLPAKSTLALLGVLLLAAGLRFYGLEIQSLWVDELASVWFSGPDSLGWVVQLTRSDVHPPGYYAVLHLAREVLGDEEWALRFPSAVAGVLSVLAIYLLGHRLYSKREGLMAALFTAIFFTPVYYGQEARSYSLLLLFSIVTTYFWWGVRARLRTGERLPLLESAGYIAAAVVCCYLHYFGLFLVALQGIALLLLAPRPLGFAALYLPVGVAYLPWVPAMLSQLRDKPPEAPPFSGYVSFLFGGSQSLQLVVWGILFLALFSVRGSLKEAGIKKTLSPLLPGGLLVAWLVVSFAVAKFVSESYAPILTVRNLIIALPAAYLLLSRAIVRAFMGDPARIAVTVGVATLALAHLFVFTGYYTEPRKQQVREAVRFVAENGGPDTLVAHCGVGREANYYYKKQDTDRSASDHVPACKADDLQDIGERIGRGDYRRLIFVRAHLKPETELLESLDREFELVRQDKLVGAGARLYEVR